MTAAAAADTRESRKSYVSALCFLPFPGGGGGGGRRRGQKFFYSLCQKGGEGERLGEDDDGCQGGGVKISISCVHSRRRRPRKRF